VCTDITKLIIFESYEIRVKVISDVELFLLAKAGNGTRDFIDDWVRDKRLDLVSGLVSITKRIHQIGVSNVIRRSQYLRHFKELSLFELKGFFGRERIMCYISDSNKMILMLFPFSGHSGKSGRVERSVLDKAKRLGKVAEHLVGKELENVKKRP
jgi:hypothetical protein